MIGLAVLVIVLADFVTVIGLVTVTGAPLTVVVEDTVLVVVIAPRVVVTVEVRVAVVVLGRKVQVVMVLVASNGVLWETLVRYILGIRDSGFR